MDKLWFLKILIRVLIIKYGLQSIYITYKLATSIIFNNATYLMSIASCKM